MTPTQAKEILEQRLSLLQAAADVEINCEMSSDVLMAQLSRREHIIDQIQKLDDSVRLIDNIKSQWSRSDIISVDILLEKARSIAEKIRLSDSKTIEQAQKNKDNILDLLKKNKLVKKYLPHNQTLKIRPPVIVDDNA